MAGGDAAVTGALRRYGDAGATELVVSPFGTEAEQARTVEAFAALRGRVQAPAYRPTRKKTTSPSWTR